MHGNTGSTAPPAAKRRNCLRRTFMASSSASKVRDARGLSRQLSRAPTKIRRATLGQQCYVLIRLYQSCNGAEMQASDRIGFRVKLHDLHVLMAVVQAGNMSKAAVLLNTTQPAISRSI